MSKEKIIEFINPNLLASEENLKLNIDDENGEPRGSFNKASYWYKTHIQLRVMSLSVVG